MLNWLTIITQQKWIYLVYALIAFGIWILFWKKETKQVGENLMVRQGKLGKWKNVPVTPNK